MPGAAAGFAEQQETVAVGRFARRAVLGIPKEGLRITVVPALQRRTYRGGADPALLLLVVGTMAAVSVVGALALSPREGLTAAFGFAFLFAPLLVFALVGLARLHSECVVDRATGRIEIRERSYRGGFTTAVRLADVADVRLVVKAVPPIVGSAERYCVYVRLPRGDYQVLAASTASYAEREGEALAIFMGVAFGYGVEAAAAAGWRREPLPWGGWALALALYAAPVLLVAGGAYLVFLSQPLSERLMLTSLGAIVASQVGAILAFAYRRGATHTW